MSLTKREILLAALNHEAGHVPSWTMAFFNYDLASKLLGSENLMTDYLPTECYKYGKATQENRMRNLKYAEAVDNYAIAVGQGGNFAFGHGGPGEFMDKLVYENEHETVSIYETGVKKIVKKNPHFYHHFDYPLKDLNNIYDIDIPNAEDENRYAGIEEDVRFYKQAGYLSYANLNGIFSGLHYYLYPYQQVLEDMLLEEEAISELIKKLAHFNLTAAEHLLKKGVEMITTCDDLGDGNSLLFSPILYDKYFYKYHCELADLCHSYHAFWHLHSHGNIISLLPRLVRTGVDIINPFDPFEIGDISVIKNEYGDRITIAGGLNRFFFTWDREKQLQELSDVINCARKDGGYILMDNGGIPENINNDEYDYYREISKLLRK